MYRKKRNYSKSHVLYSILFVAVIILNNLLPFEKNDSPLTVKYIDVQQGDSTLILLPDNKTMLIDTGEERYSNVLINELRASKVKKIDYLIATHPHTDHIGGMERIINEYEIGNVYMPKAEHTSKTYIDLLETVSDKNLKITTAKAGVNIIDEPDLYAEFVAPNSDYYDEVNNYSAILKLTYKKNSFIFCGDAETLSEKEVLSAGFDVTADVLKVSHHGSSGSTSDAFLEAVNPKYAIISCGEDNEYGHPHKEILKKLENVTVFRTDEMGTITLYSDGKNIER